MRTTSNEDEWYILCTHLCHKDKKEFNSFAVTWPPFIWSTLINEEVHQEYGESVWSLIPMTWRRWWMECLKVLYPLIYGNITMSTPVPVVKDVTREKKRWEDELKRETIGALKNAIDSQMMPTILCPWGCTEYVHKCGKLKLDVTYQRYLLKARLKVINKNEWAKVKTCREDFIRWDGDYDTWLMNPSWKIVPCV